MFSTYIKHVQCCPFAIGRGPRNHFAKYRYKCVYIYTCVLSKYTHHTLKTCQFKALSMYVPSDHPSLGAPCALPDNQLTR